MRLELALVGAISFRSSVRSPMWPVRSRHRWPVHVATDMIHDRTESIADRTESAHDRTESIATCTDLIE